MWQKTMRGGKAGFDKLYGWVDKLGAPVNKLSNKVGSEAFWPMSIDKESDKAARILRSFCKDGFYEKESKPVVPGDSNGPKQEQKVLKKIPAEVIRNAKGLAIFTTMRTGFWLSGAGGAGVLLGRLPDGSWSPPSGILLHTAGFGFLIGVDIYDCVIVLNTQEALDAFSHPRFTLGGEISAVAGPVGIGGLLETEVHKRRAPVFTYLKSRGFYAGIQIDGTVIIERSDENEKFYNERLPASAIVSGKVRHPPFEVRTLMETIKAAQGDTDVNDSLLPEGPSMGDMAPEEVHEKSKFGIPDPGNPDPFGYLELEKEGIHIREAGTNHRPTSEQFEFRPSPTSPVWSTFHRSSVDGISRRSSWRTSTLSVPERAPTVDMAVQTDMDGPLMDSPRSTASNSRTSHLVMNGIPENNSTDDVPAEKLPSPQITVDKPAETGPEESADEPEDEPVIIHSVQQAAAPQVISRARLVSVPKRGPPPTLPPRNPVRDRKRPLIVTGNNTYGSSEDGSKDPSTSISPLSYRSNSVDEGKSPTSIDSESSVEQFDAIRESLARVKVEEKSDENSEISSRNVTEVLANKTSKSLSSRDQTPPEDEFRSMATTPARSPSPIMPGAMPS